MEYQAVLNQTSGFYFYWYVTCCYLKKRRVSTNCLFQYAKDKGDCSCFLSFLLLQQSTFGIEASIAVVDFAYRENSGRETTTVVVAVQLSNSSTKGLVHPNTAGSSRKKLRRERERERETAQCGSITGSMNTCSYINADVQQVSLESVPEFSWGAENLQGRQESIKLAGRRRRRRVRRRQKRKNSLIKKFAETLQVGLPKKKKLSRMVT